MCAIVSRDGQMSDKPKQKRLSPAVCSGSSKVTSGLGSTLPYQELI
jgi:hypothetical protein